MVTTKEVYKKIVQAKQMLESSSESLDSMERSSPEEDYGYLRMTDDLELVIGDLLILQRRLEVILGHPTAVIEQGADSFRDKYDW